MAKSSSKNRSSKKNYRKEQRAKLLETIHLGRLYKGREKVDVESHRRHHIENEKMKDEE